MPSLITKEGVFYLNFYAQQGLGNSHFPHLEEVRFTYRKVTWTHEVSNTLDSDDWRAPVVKLRLIVTSICQLCWSVLYTPLQNFAYIDPLLRASTYLSTFTGCPPLLTLRRRSTTSLGSPCCQACLG